MAEITTLGFARKSVRADDEVNDLDSMYVERYWLPVVGPSSILLLRHLHFGGKPEGAWYESPVDLAKALGLGSGTGRNSPLMRTLSRLNDFGLLTEWRGLGKDHERLFSVPQGIVDVPGRHWGRLPVSLTRELLEGVGAER